MQENYLDRGGCKPLGGPGQFILGFDSEGLGTG
jgi:hypothetical protein